MDEKSKIHSVLAAMAKESQQAVSEIDLASLELCEAKDKGLSQTKPAQEGDRRRGERRRHPRYKCEGSAEFRSEGSSVRTWASVTDLSRGGCYVEMYSTFPEDTAVDLVIEVAGYRFHTKGLVRITYPFLGMGIAFSEISGGDLEQLDALLHHLEGGLSPEAPAGHPQLDVSRVLDQSAALGAVAKFFQNHEILTREQFGELLTRNERMPH